MNTAKKPEMAEGLPGIGVSASIKMPIAKDANLTVGTGAFNFDSVKSMLSTKPLHRPSRSRPLDDDDAGDVKLIREAMSEPGKSISHEDFKRELGM